MRQPEDITLKCGRTLKQVLELHAAWRIGEASARAANLSGANLMDANLSGVNLRYANLSEADLSGANLRGADLSEANLRYANLSEADLSGANLRGADLRNASLTGANLRGANLRNANLIGANLTDANLTTDVVVENIDAAIIDAIKHDDHSLDMGSWHSCSTSHCRAGWAIKLAGEAGRILEDIFGPNAAGAMIYAASGSHPVPDWFASSEETMDDLHRRAGITT